MRANVPSKTFSRAGENRPRRPERLVIGYGNDLRCDDGAGVRVATKLAEQFPPLRVIVAHQLTPELAGDIAAAEQVVFVDAYAADARDAALRVERISRGSPVSHISGKAAGAASVLGHRGDPDALIGLANRLFGADPEAWVVGIPAFYFGLGEVLSPETRCRIDEAVALIGKNEFRETQGGSPE